MGDEQARRNAENESVFREVNEHVEDAHERLGVRGETEFLCECGDPGCTTRVSLTLDEYEELREAGRLFVVRHGHVAPDVERVVGENERFLIVEKTGVAGEIAEKRDPRAASAD